MPNPTIAQTPKMTKSVKARKTRPAKVNASASPPEQPPTILSPIDAARHAYHDAQDAERALAEQIQQRTTQPGALQDDLARAELACDDAVRQNHRTLPSAFLVED